jgi:uncharacterized protein YcbX
VRTVVGINVTPVKSTALHHPSAVRLEAWGPVHDRLFFFVDDRGQRFGGDAKAPLMVIHSAFDAERDRLWMRMPEGWEVEGSAAGTGDALAVDHVGTRVAAHEVEGDWARVLTDYVGRPTRLARLVEPGTLVDEPVTVVSLASVREAGRHGGRESLEAARFRMTFELEGCEPHEEDTWTGRRVAMGEAELSIGGPVPRCVITTIHPDTGRRDFPTLKVIAGYRDPLPDGGLPFGLYAKVTRPGTVRIGDDVALR